MSLDNIFNLSDDERLLALSKNSDKNKLGFAVLLKYFQFEGHYPKHIKYIDPLMLNCLANQLGVSTACINEFDWEGRSTKRFRQEVRELLGYKKASLEDIEKLKTWLIANVFPSAVKKSQRVEYAYEYFCEYKIEPFTSQELERHIDSAHLVFEQQLFDSIHDTLSEQTKKMMDILLSEEGDTDNENQDEDDDRNPT